jgi:hypothetical protein
MELFYLQSSTMKHRESIALYSCHILVLPQLANITDGG